MALILDGTDGITSSGGTNVLQDASVEMSNLNATGNPGAGNFLRGDGAWETAGSPPGTLELLQEDIFTTSGTFTKAAGFDDDDTVMAFLVGGGSSGAAVRTSSGAPNGAATGGVGATCIVMVGRYQDITTSTWELTVGAGGAAVSATTDGAAINGASGGATNLRNSTTNVFFTCREGINGHARPVSSGRIFAERYLLFNTLFGNAAVLSNFNGSSDVGLNKMGDYYSDASLRQNSGQAPIAQHGHGGYDTDNERNTNSTILFFPPTFQILGSGGCAARQGATNRTSWNQKVLALFNSGGNGSGTANGQNGSFPGGGGGGCVRPAGTTATSGAGGGGGLVVQYYRGRVSPWQVITAVGA